MQKRKDASIKIAQYKEPLYAKPTSYYTESYNNYFVLHQTVLTSPGDFHLEQEAVFLYVESGHGQVVINGMVFPVEPGCALMLQTYHVYRFFPAKGDPLRLLAVILDYPLLGAIGYQKPNPRRIESSMDQMPIVYCTPAAQRDMTALLDKFQRVPNESSLQSALIKAGLCGQLAFLYRKESIRSEIEVSSFPLGWRAWPYITKFCTKNITAAGVAAVMGGTGNQLNRELRQISGYDFRKLLTRARVNLAASSLLLRGISMQYLAREVGFPSENALFHSFKEWRSMTHLELRAKMLSPENHCPRYMIYEKPFLILPYIAGHYREPISLDSVSKELFLSKATVSQIVFSYFGLPFHRIVTEFRLSHAKGLLACTDIPILDISISLGFSSGHTFSRIFKEYFQMTPTEYRRKAATHEARI